MINKKLILILILLFSGMTARTEKIKVAFICERLPDVSSQEIKEAYRYLNEYMDADPQVILINDITGGKLKDFRIAWIHSDNFSVKSFSGKKGDYLRKWISEGGRLFLSADAFKLVVPLCGEKNLPYDSIKPVVDDGYGRRLGIHSFLSHPVFEGMYGGAYLLRPVVDTVVKICGYFGDVIPLGRVIGVDWDYIFIREKSKLLLEYNIGKGRVIASGAYMNFSLPNHNLQHLIKFTSNTLRYLGFDSNSSESKFWNYQKQEISKCNIPQTDPFITVPPESREWKIKESDLDIHEKYATDNYWDLAGERILIMGTEKAGIEEVWVHPFMAFRDYEVGIRFGYKDSVFWLRDERPEITVTPESFIRNYKFPRAYLKEIISNDRYNPAGVVHYEYDGVYEAKLIIRLRSNFRLMWPYSENTTGNICYTWNGDLNGLVISDSTLNAAIIAGANRSPEKHSEGPSSSDYSVNAEMIYPLKMTDRMDFIFTAGNEGREAVTESFRDLLRNPNAVYKMMTGYTDEFLGNTLMITTPDENFNKGYRWALLATDRFFVNTPGMGKSLVAGYASTRKGWDGGHAVNGRPGYGWYFGRDGEWSGFAVTDYGDFSKIRSILEFYGKYQDLSGKIFHEATTSGVIHYDASDATPLYIVLFGKYFRHSGDTAFLKQHWDEVKKAIDFCFSTDTDNDHLIENTNVGHGWVEGGELYGSHETIYMAGCWGAALDEAFYMASAVSDPVADSYRIEAALVRQETSKRFTDRTSGITGYGINKDGKLRTEPTILPAVPLYFKVLEKEMAKPMFSMYASNAFSTNWGTRILSENSRLFRPTGYHYGSVWPLFTGWASLAEYRSGNVINGFSHIMNNLNIYKNWGLGFTEEVLNGSVYEPSGVCPHQCWSETMVIQPAIEGLLGFDANVAYNRIYLSPALPADWDTFKAENIRMGNKRVNFSMTRKENGYMYSFSTIGGALNIEFAPALPAGTKVSGARLNGESVNISSFRSNKAVIIAAMMNLTGNDILEIDVDKGISVLPVVSDPKPGDSAAGCRILDYGLEGDTYFVEAEAPSGTDAELSIYIKGFTAEKISGGSVLSKNSGGSKLILKVPFEKSDNKYTVKRITLSLK